MEDIIESAALIVIAVSTIVTAFYVEKIYSILRK